MHQDFPVYIDSPLAVFLFAIWVGLCAWAWIEKQYTRLVTFMVAAGAYQAVLVSLTGRLIFQWSDDIVALMLISSGIFTTLGSDFRRFRSPLVVFLTVGVIAAVGTVRAVDRAAGVAQARQVLIPAGLVLAGYVLRERIDWPQLMRRIALIGGSVIAWMLVEGVRQWPILDPLPSIALRRGDPYIEARDGLPLSYWADGITELPWFRPGGPLMNPPTAGFLLGVAMLAFLSLRPGFTRMVGALATAVALGLTYSRAGILIAACVTLAYWSWRVLGRTITAVGLAATAYVLFGVFAQQGNTASHSEGLAGGLLVGLRTVIGTGFGAFGYQSINPEDGEVSESLLGLLFGWLGVPMLLVVVWLVVRLATQLFAAKGEVARLLWFGASMLITAAVSETASALSGTGAAWMLVGLCLAKELPASETSPLTQGVPKQELAATSATPSSR